jgi:hypothetical protein
MRWLKTTDGEGSANGKLRSLIVDQMLILHTRDLSSLIRAKCLQLLAKLVEENSLEPIEVANCMTAAIDRMDDCAVLPRKYSITLINNILTKFPGICTVSIITF